MTYRTLEEIRLRKEQLSDQIQQDTTRFSTLWSQVFLRRENSSKGEYISSLVTHGVTAVDTFLLIRKLMKNYRSVFGRKAGKKKR